MFKKNEVKPFENHIYLASPTMHGDELKYVTEAYETNWMSTVGANINEVERLIGEGRPVLVGTTNVETSELLSKMLKMRRIEHSVLNAKLHQKEADIVALAGQSNFGKYTEKDAEGNIIEKEGMLGAVTIATNMAGRGTDIKINDEVKALGGLCVFGTERHESRRIDNQLRGRAARQGDPGSTRFFLSLEDNLMRIFGGDKITNLMNMMNLKFKTLDSLELKMELFLQFFQWTR